jgi:hypothetical protein
MSLASRDTGVFAINILMSFGAIAVVAGILALNPTFATGAAIGVALLLIGLAVSFGAAERWSLLGTAGMVIGALPLSGGVIGLLDASFAALVFTAVLLLVLAVTIRSTGYFHATYMLIVRKPTITIGSFALFAFVAYFVAKPRRAGPRGWRSSRPACPWSSSISDSGSAPHGATIPERAGRLVKSIRGSPAKPGKSRSPRLRLGFHHRLGPSRDRRRHLGRARQPALGRHHGGHFWRHQFLHAVV